MPLLCLRGREFTQPKNSLGIGLRGMVRFEIVLIALTVLWVCNAIHIDGEKKWTQA